VNETFELGFPQKLRQVLLVERYKPADANSPGWTQPPWLH